MRRLTLFLFFCSALPCAADVIPTGRADEPGRRIAFPDPKAANVKVADTGLGAAVRQAKRQNAGPIASVARLNHHLGYTSRGQYVNNPDDP